MKIRSILLLVEDSCSHAQYPPRHATAKAKDDEKQGRGKVIYFSIKGSDCTADFLANFCLRTTPYNLPGPFVEGSQRVMWSHEVRSCLN